MRALRSPLLAGSLAAAALLASVPSASALAAFDLFYDSVLDGQIVEEDVVGVGRISWDGTPTLGFTPFSAMTDLSIQLDYLDGALSFTEVDLIGDRDATGVLIFEIAGGLGLTFYSDQMISPDGPPGSAVEFQTVDAVLSHEPYTDGAPCCGGDGVVNLAQLTIFSEEFNELGEYAGVAAASPVPLPAAGALLAGGLMGLAALRRRRAA
ncbi:hypothetical protein [Albimonas pacifica]|uniref:VPLPA-CTERM protein sorting domain-containing protein n=1 Tax=Albimonas pacifica TaxID=1114924 RepID=A0A1I3G7J7_9RHOB|nr:hypothetical protein [Albimonas pacifica]SFI19466.1 VPLPA-CTERM protein sorting domain-containing protein [Albimonas pacifica]